MMKQISKTKIERKLKRKLNPALVETIILAKKHKQWLRIAKLLSTPRRKFIKKNLNEINNMSSEGDTIVIPGKVLALGDIEKRIKISALSYSETAIKKLKDKNCKIGSIIEEIKTNPKASGVKILK